MQLNVSGHHVEVTDSLRDYVESKIEKIARHFDIVSDVQCILTVEKLRHKAEATASVNGGTIYCDHTEEDMYAAIDGLVDKLERRVRKYKEKLVDHHAKRQSKVPIRLIQATPARTQSRRVSNNPAPNTQSNPYVASKNHQAGRCTVQRRSAQQKTLSRNTQRTPGPRTSRISRATTSSNVPHRAASAWDVQVWAEALRFRTVGLRALTRVSPVLIKLSEPVDFDAPDGEPVDLVLGMMVPVELDDSHRADIKLVTDVLADEGLRARLREMNSSERTCTTR